MPLTGTLHPLAKQEFDAGLVDNAKVLQGMTINFKRSAAQEASLKALWRRSRISLLPAITKWLAPASLDKSLE